MLTDIDHDVTPGGNYVSKLLNDYSSVLRRSQSGCLKFIYPLVIWESAGFINL